MDFFRRNHLYALVFLTGAASLIIEVSGTRILSPYFGNTIYTVSGVISIVLAALSCGYYAGGRIADTHASEQVFYTCILLGGVAAFLIQLSNMLLLPLFGYSLPLTYGPVISAIMLFFLPSFILGMLSPFAIALQHRRYPKQGVGAISGTVFFASTLGSILGSLATGLVLIPTIGISWIIMGTATGLCVLGGAGMLMKGRQSHTGAKLLVALAVLSGGAVSLMHPLGKNMVYVRDGIYEKISIYDGVYHNRPARFFMQDRSMSGAMYLDSKDLVFDYTTYFRIYKAFASRLEKALVIGGGAYSIPKAMVEDMPRVHVDVLEIEPSLFELAHTYFNLPHTRRITNIVQDGRRYLADTTQSYDMIFGDVYYSLYSIPVHFTTQEYFRLVKKRLNPGGLFVMNYVGTLSRDKDILTLPEIQTFRSVFPNSYYFALGDRNSLTVQNMIFVGYNSGKQIDFGDSRLRNHAEPVVREAARSRIDLSAYNLEAYTTLTDDYAPVEYMMSRTIAERRESENRAISGEEALRTIESITSLGSRSLTSTGHSVMQTIVSSQLQASNLTVTKQRWQHVSADGTPYTLTNIIGRYRPDAADRIIIGTHYDSKRYADRDLLYPNRAVPGANDSASGVAVALEVARYLARTASGPPVGVDIVFFDGEEGEEDLSATAWKPLGSTYFAKHLSDMYGDTRPSSALVLDMVCDKDLSIYREKNSDRYARSQVDTFWKGARMPPFIDESRWRIEDDHMPLNEAGIPSFLVIDFDYGPFHTTGDTADKCSSRSLQDVGDAVLEYLYSPKGGTAT